MFNVYKSVLNDTDIFFVIFFLNDLFVCHAVHAAFRHCTVAMEVNNLLNTLLFLSIHIHLNVQEKNSF